MTTNTRVNVVPDGEGAWRVRVIQSTAFDTQEDAIAYARNVNNETSGELTIWGEDGRIREKDSGTGANDPPEVKG